MVGRYLSVLVGPGEDVYSTGALLDSDRRHVLGPLNNEGGRVLPCSIDERGGLALRLSAKRGHHEPPLSCERGR